MCAFLRRLSSFFKAPHVDTLTSDRGPPPWPRRRKNPPRKRRPKKKVATKKSSARGAKKKKTKTNKKTATTKRKAAANKKKVTKKKKVVKKKTTKKKPAAKKKAPTKKKVAKKKAPAKKKVAKKKPVAKDKAPPNKAKTKAAAKEEKESVAKRARIMEQAARTEPAPRKPKVTRKLVSLDDVTISDDYKPSPKEPYMNPKHLLYFKHKLEAWREELITESQETLEHLRSETRDVGDEAERASRESDNILELRTPRPISQVVAQNRRSAEADRRRCIRLLRRDRRRDRYRTPRGTSYCNLDGRRPGTPRNVSTPVSGRPLSRRWTELARRAHSTATLASALFVLAQGCLTWFEPESFPGSAR